MGLFSTFLLSNIDSSLLFNYRFPTLVETISIVQKYDFHSWAGALARAAIICTDVAMTCSAKLRGWDYSMNLIILGTVNKRRLQLGGKEFVQFCGQGERRFFRCGRPHFFAQKTLDFSKFMVRPHGRGEDVEPVRTFYGEWRRGQFFAILCGPLLWTAPY